MIASIRGTIINITEDAFVVEVNGLGLLVFVPLHRMDGLYRMEEEIFLYTHLIVREDQWTLFGFPSIEELTLFKQILNVSGIGGKGALQILNQLSPAQIAAAITRGETKPFEAVSGIGKKTAQRIVLELKDKIAKMGIAAAEGEIPVAQPKNDAGNNDALAALVQLGYSTAEAKKAVVAVISDDPLIDGDTLLRKALLRLSKF